MKKLILISVIVLSLGACGTKNTSVHMEAEKIIENAKTEALDHSLVNVEFSNPGFMAGSSFGEFFISMLRTQNYQMALKFTSKGSIDKYSSKVILDKYSAFKYNYVLVQHSIVQVGDTFTVTYATNEMATGKLKKLTLVLENDTCKLVLPDNLDELLK